MTAGPGYGGALMVALAALVATALSVLMRLVVL